MNNKKLNRIIEARFIIVTPMFLGGADYQPDEIRPTSVKGMLRFWWRAFQWQHFRGSKFNDTDALKELYKKEAKLFGSAVDRGKGGQGVFLLKVIHSELVTEKANFKDAYGKAYLAGMGLRYRKYLAVNQEFSLQLFFHPHTEDKDVQSIRDAVRIFGMLGGLGSRTRRGFGSITQLVNDNGCYRLPTDDELTNDCAWLKEHCVNKQADVLAPFSAFDGNTKFYQYNRNFVCVDQALQQLGATLNRYRTNGTSQIKDKEKNVISKAKPGYRLVGGEEIKIDSLPFFNTDHNLVYAMAKDSSINDQNGFPPQRTIFGLPHAYYFSSINKRVSFEYQPGKEKQRRASPMLIHIAAFTNAKGEFFYRPLLLLMPAQFLPRDSKLKVYSNKRLGEVPAPRNQLSAYKPIMRFFDSENFIAW